MLVEKYNWLKTVFSNVSPIFLNFIPDLKDFGLKVAFYNFIGELSICGPEDFSKIFRKKQHDCINEFLVNEFSDIIQYYKNNKIEVGVNNKKIWCMWWQGFENAPTIVKNCVKNIGKYSGDYELILLTQNNYRDYANIPSEIIEKVENGKISITHFSDILRAKLLSEYGGIWIDSTMFICDYIFNEFDDITFNSAVLPKFTDMFSKRLCGFFMGGKPNMFFSFLYDFFIAYNLKYDRLINYFLIDFGIEIAYDSFEECKSYFDNITLNNPMLLYFEMNLNPFNHAEFESMCEKYKYFKVTQKVSPHLFYDKNGNLTYSGYFFMDNED